MASRSSRPFVTSPVPIRSARRLAELLKDWGGLDILVNNAGVAYYGPTECMTAEQWQRLLAVNLLAPIQFTRELLPTLLERPEAHILNVCSIAGLVASGRLAAYHVSKYGLVGFSEALRAEFDRRGLGVTALCPGLVRTNIFQAAVNGRPEKPKRTPPAWLCASPETIANQAVRAIVKNRGLVVVTPMARFLWYFKRLSPSLLSWISSFGKRKKVGGDRTPTIESVNETLRRAAQTTAADPRVGPVSTWEGSDRACSPSARIRRPACNRCCRRFKVARASVLYSPMLDSRGFGGRNEVRRALT